MQLLQFLKQQSYPYQRQKLFICKPWVYGHQNLPWEITVQSALKKILLEFQSPARRISFNCLNPGTLCHTTGSQMWCSSKGSGPMEWEGHSSTESIGADSDGPGFKPQLNYFLQGLLLDREGITAPILQGPVGEFNKEMNEATRRGQLLCAWWWWWQLLG